jgi:hypothetical protein
MTVEELKYRQVYREALQYCGVDFPDGINSWKLSFKVTEWEDYRSNR